MQTAGRIGASSSLRACPQLRTAARRRHVAARADFSAGDKVKVISDLTVYHVPGFKAGLDIKGKEGVVDKNVTMFDGVKLSPNMPWKVAFEAENKGKTKKFFVHLDDDELEKV